MAKITFSCEECSQQLVVQEEHVGRRVRCSSCQNIMVVPEPNGTGPIAEPPPQSYRSAPSGPPPTPRSDPFSPPSDFDVRESSSRTGSTGTEASDFDAGYDEDRYADDDADEPWESSRRKSGERRKAPSAGPAGTIALILLILGGIGAVIWYGMKGGIADDIKLVPKDVTMMATIRPADLWKSHWATLLRAQVGEAEMRNGMEEKTKPFGLKLEDVERITFFTNEKLVLGAEPRNQTFVILTEKDYDQSKVKAGFEQSYGGRDPSRSQKHKGKELWVARDAAVYFHSERIFVVGPREGVEQSIEASTNDSKAKGSMQAAREAASDDKYQIVLGAKGNIFDTLKELGQQNPLFKNLNRGLPGGAAPFELDGISGFHVAMGITKDLDMAASLTYESEAPARRLANKLDDGLTEVRRKGRAQLRHADMMPAKDRELARDLLDFLDSIDMDREGATVTFELEMKKDLLEKMINRRNQVGP